MSDIKRLEYLAKRALRVLDKLNSCAKNINSQLQVAIAADAIGEVKEVEELENMINDYEAILP